MRVITINANLVWEARQADGCDRWVVSCAPLDIILEANSKDEISGLIEEAVDLLFVDLLEDGELDTFLADRNWSKTESPSQQTREPSGVEFKVPWELAMKDSQWSQMRPS